MAHIGTRRVAAAGQAAEQVGEAAREGARQASPWIVPLARVGYAAKGVVYLVIAWLALKVAIGRGGAFANSRSALEWIGQGPVGLAARAVVFALIGWFLVRAALRFDPNQAGGIDESLAALGAQPFGRVILGAVALGLAAYGGYSLAEARWRRMRMA